MRATVVLLALLFSPLLMMAQAVKCPPPATHIAIDKGEYSPLPGVTFNVEGFVATMVPRGKRAPLCYVKTAVVERGQASVSSESLNHVVEQKMKSGSIQNVKIEFKENAARISGKVKKVIPLPFEIEGPVTTDGTNIRFEAKSIKAAGLPVKALIGMVGAHLASLIGSKSPKGMEVQGNTIIFQPEELVHARGHLASLEVTPQGLFVKFAPPQATKRESARLARPRN
jgi:hypothetical protein